MEEQKQLQSRIFRKVQAGQFMMHKYFVMGNVRNVAFNFILFCWDKCYVRGNVAV